MSGRRVLVAWMSQGGFNLCIAGKPTYHSTAHSGKSVRQIINPQLPPMSHRRQTGRVFRRIEGWICSSLLVDRAADRDTGPLASRVYEYIIRPVSTAEEFRGQSGSWFSWLVLIYTHVLTGGMCSPIPPGSRRRSHLHFTNRRLASFTLQDNYHLHIAPVFSLRPQCADTNGSSDATTILDCGSYHFHGLWYGLAGEQLAAMGCRDNGVSYSPI